VTAVCGRTGIVSWTAGLVLLFAAHAIAATQDTNSPQGPASETQQETPSLKRLSIEELARISVVSASRHTEPVTDAAAAITVITGDAIRRSGVRTLPDALRLALGVSVSRDGFAWAISARGFNASTTNKMVVMIDGRSIYTPLFSGVFWDAQDLLLADIDRIEVIRGAGGTLWGANAVNGVINIITKLATDTEGLLVQAGGGSELGIVGARYGGRAGKDGAFRVYGKARRFDALPFANGNPSEAPLVGQQAGVRLDLGPASTTSITLQGDGYHTTFGVPSTSDGRANGGNALMRVRHTYQSGSQVQLQVYYDDTFRSIPSQYAERRRTADSELQFRFSAGARQDIVSGLGITATHDRVTPTPTFSFDPLSRTTTLLNAFVQDEIDLVPGRLAAILGSKFEHNSYTGFEIQPTGRLRWTPAKSHLVWGGVSRAVRMPSRFDTDLRFTAGTPILVISGNSDFQSETALVTEAGYRTWAVPKLAFGITAFGSVYDQLRSQEPSAPAGLPIVLGNKHNGRVSGLEVGAHYEPSASWQLFGGYTRLFERFDFDADSRDPTGGSLEHNDPAHQVLVRSYSDLPRGFSFDAVARWVSALPRPAVPAYGELTLRVAHPVGDHMEVELIGDNLLHDRHLELVQVGPPHEVTRSVYVRLSWRSR